MIVHYLHILVTHHTTIYSSRHILYTAPAPPYPASSGTVQVAGSHIRARTHGTTKCRNGGLVHSRVTGETAVPIIPKSLVHLDAASQKLNAEESGLIAPTIGNANRGHKSPPSPDLSLYTCLHTAVVARNVKLNPTEVHLQVQRCPSTCCTPMDRRISSSNKCLYWYTRTCYISAAVL